MAKQKRRLDQVDLCSCVCEQKSDSCVCCETDILEAFVVKLRAKQKLCNERARCYRYVLAFSLKSSGAFNLSNESGPPLAINYC